MERRGLTEGSHMFTGTNGKEPNERNLHRSKRPNNIPRRIRDINLVAKPAHQDEHKRMQRNHIGDEDVSAPCCDHPSVKEGREHAPECGTLLDGADPEVEGVHEKEDGDGFVVVGAGDGSGDVAWCEGGESGVQLRFELRTGYDTDKRSRQQTRRFVRHLTSEPTTHQRLHTVHTQTTTHKYVAIAVNPAKAGASITQTFLISTGKFNQCKTL
jgi:hypothetical protein